MGRVVSMSLAAIHLRLDDVDAESELLEILIDAAESHVERWLRRSLVPWDAADPSVPTPSCVKAAILLVLGDLFDNRSGNTDKPLTENATLVRLLSVHRRGLGL